MLSVPAGIQALFLEIKEIRKIKSKMSCQKLSAQQLPYREMERLRQVRCGAWDAFRCRDARLCLPAAAGDVSSLQKGAQVHVRGFGGGSERLIPPGEVRPLPKNRAWKLRPGPGLSIFEGILRVWHQILILSSNFGGSFAGT